MESVGTGGIRNGRDSSATQPMALESKGDVMERKRRWFRIIDMFWGTVPVRVAMEEERRARRRSRLRLIDMFWGTAPARVAMEQVAEAEAIMEQEHVRENGTVQYEVRLVTGTTIQEVGHETSLVIKELVGMGFGVVSCQLSELQGSPVMTIVFQRGLKRIVSEGARRR